jgi:hypothetical protein
LARIEADQTTIADINLVKVCDGATIVGSVVSATTGQPIQGAFVQAANASAQTDAQGNFVLGGVSVGNQNAPAQVFVTASASGFQPQTKTVTVFCGATIRLDFGRPESGFGTIQGTVTNLDTGQPLGGAFVGSEFGGSATTDTSPNFQTS